MSNAATRKEALQLLQDEGWNVVPVQEFEVRRLEREDCWGVARCFYAVYGPTYPFDYPYIPDRLWNENHVQNTYSVVAVATDGSVIGYGAIYRSTAPYSGLYEIGQYLVLPEYRTTTAAFKIQEFLLQQVVPDIPLDELFGEAVCNHIVSQKMGAFAGFRECALELGLMPAVPGGAQSGSDRRISTLLQFKGISRLLREAYLPAQYREQLEYLYSGFSFQRTFAEGDGAVPPGSATRATSQFFNVAGVARFNIQNLGSDFFETLLMLEEHALRRKIGVLQVFLNLGEPHVGNAISVLQSAGYVFGGLLPCWFGSDGLLMQKLTDLPDLDAIALYSERAHRILDFIRMDIENNPAAQLITRSLPCIPADLPLTKAADFSDVTISGEGLTITGLAAVARHGASVSVSDAEPVTRRVEASASFIRWGTSTGEPIYGVNTGFGGMANVAIPEPDIRALQNNLIRFLEAGAGGSLSTADVRGALLLRANSHLKGASGVRRELIDRMVLFLNKGYTPCVRELGSIGASGDLVPLASITGALIGADPSFCVERRGARVDCLTALRELGLEPFELGPKEGLAMVNGTSVMTAIAANRLYELRSLIALSLAFHSFAIQALHGSNQSFHPYIQQLKPHPGQIQVADIMLSLLKGSRFSRNELDGHHDSMGGQPIQDRYSLRCLPQFLGPVVDCLHAATAATEIEMNSANDNPMIDGENCTSYHSGNFLGQYISVWMDQMRLHIGLMAKHIDAQIALLVSPEFNCGLPASLVGNTERKVNMGLKGLQISANSIMAMLLYHTKSIADLFPTHAEQFNQNINSQGFNSAMLTARAVELLRTYLSQALLFGVQAVELRSRAGGEGCDPRSSLAPLAVPLYEAVKETLGRTPDDRRPLIWNDDEQSLEQFVDIISADIAAEGRVVDAVRPLIGMLAVRHNDSREKGVCS